MRKKGLVNEEEMEKKEKGTRHVHGDLSFFFKPHTHTTHTLHGGLVVSMNL